METTLSLLYGHTGEVLITDGVDAPLRLGNEGQALVSSLHGEYYELCKRGNLFISSTVVAGLAIPISTSTAPVSALWNPAGSGVNAVLLRFLCAYVSGTTVGGSIGLSRSVGAGAEIATGAVFTAFAKTTPINGLMERGKASKIFSSNAGTNTLTAAGTWFYTMFEEYAAVATSAINSGFKDHDFKGALIVTPGVAVYPTGAAASGALLAQTWVWVEVPA